MFEWIGNSMNLVAMLALGGIFWGLAILIGIGIIGAIGIGIRKLIK